MCQINEGNNISYRSSKVEAGAGRKFHWVGQWSSMFQSRILKLVCEVIYVPPKDPWMEFINGKNILKWHGKFCFYVLIFHGGVRFSPFHGWDFWLPVQAVFCLKPLANLVLRSFASTLTSALHYLSSCIVKLWVNSCLMSQVPSNWASIGLLLLSPYLLPETSQRMNFLSLSQLLRTGFLIPVARFPSASYLSPCSFLLSLNALA